MKTITAAELRANQAEILASVRYTNEPVVVENYGKPTAVIVSPEEWERMNNRRAVVKRAWQAMERIRDQNKDKDPDDELAFITKVVEDVRQEQYDERQQTKSSDW